MTVTDMMDPIASIPRRRWLHTATLACGTITRLFAFLSAPKPSIITLTPMMAIMTDNIATWLCRRLIEGSEARRGASDGARAR